MGTPLKLNGTDGDVKFFSTSEENYISYQIGLALKDGNRTTESSLDNLPGGTTVGTYTDTVYDQPVGTHGTTLTTTTTNTSLFQNTGTADESGSDFKRPIHWNTALTPDAIQEMTDTNFNACVDRLIAKVFASDYPGTFKLAATAPSADYSVFLENLFTDTTLAGPGLRYSIWKRNAMTAPTTVRSVAIKRVSGNGATDDFAGLQEMTDAEIKYTFGQRAKTRISTSLIGTYQLRNSSQGVPSATGTWVAKGTALDTNNETPDVDFTNNYTGDYGSNYVSNSTSVFAGNYLADYTGDFTGNYVGDFAGNYLSDLAYVSNSTRNSVVYSVGNYIGATAANSTRTSVGYADDGATFYTGDYVGAADVAYAGDYAGDFTGDFAGNYSGLVDYASNSTAASTRNSTLDSTTAYVGEYTGDFTGDYSAAYAGDYTGNYISAQIAGTFETIDTYTLYVRTA